MGCNNVETANSHAVIESSSSGEGSTTMVCHGPAGGAVGLNNGITMGSGSKKVPASDGEVIFVSAV